MSDSTATPDMAANQAVPPKSADTAGAKKFNPDELRVLEMLHKHTVGEVVEMRSTAVRVLFWSVTVTMLVVGWIVSAHNADKPMSCHQKWLFTVAIAIFASFTTALLCQLRSYFDDVAGVINRIDWLLGAHEPGRYCATDTLYPKAWQKFGSREYREPIFTLGFWGLFLIAAFATAAVWIR
jgi:hypothetical protein